MEIKKVQRSASVLILVKADISGIQIKPSKFQMLPEHYKRKNK